MQLLLRQRAHLGGGRLAARETEVSARNASFVASLKDLLGGFPLVKSFGAEGPAARQFAASNRELEGAKRARSLAQGAILALAMFGRLFTKHGVMLAGAWMAVSGVGGITAGTVVFFVYAMDYVAQPIEDLPQAIAGRRAMRALVARMAGALASNAQAPGAPEVPAGLRRGVSLRDVGFAYPGGARVLDGVSAEIPAGSAWAVVGASGSGKSTLLSLLMGASGAYDGSIALDGVEVREASPASLYRAACLVSQDVFLFDATLRDNVTMFGEADDASLMRAVGRAGLGAFVGEHGLDAPCGQGGRNLSGGERQRVAIARGLLRGAGTLLLDEATSALDARTAGRVMDSILSLGGVTRLVVTHRLAADELARFDGILVLRDGRVEEAGAFGELMAARGYFYALYTVGQGA